METMPLPQAAKELGMTRSNLWLMVKMGKAKAELIWGRYFIEREEVERLKYERSMGLESTKAEDSEAG